jgi:diketogulonate reductase-like aldo/keto reductase
MYPLLQEAVPRKAFHCCTIPAFLSLLAVLGLILSPTSPAWGIAKRQLVLQKPEAITALVSPHFLQSARSFPKLKMGGPSPVGAMEGDVRQMPHLPRPSRCVQLCCNRAAACPVTFCDDSGSPSPFVMTNSGVQMPRMIYSIPEKEELDTEVLVQSAIWSGFNGIDIGHSSKCTGVQGFDNCDLATGLALKSMLHHNIIQRDCFFIQRKLNLDWSFADKLAPVNQSIGKQVKVAIKQSLSDLGVDYVDSLLLNVPEWHHHTMAHEQTMDAWRAMEDAVQVGLVRQLGIANVLSLGQLRAIYTDASIKPAVVQRGIHTKTWFEREMRVWCAEARIYFQSSSNSPAENKHLLHSKTMAGLAAKYNVDPQVLFFRFLLDLGILTVAGTGSDDHAIEDIRAYEVPLTSQDSVELCRLCVQKDLQGHRTAHH